MTLTWSDTKSFRQHLEHMRDFRRTHCGDLNGRFTPIKDLPTPSDTRPPSKTGGARSYISINGNSILVPIRNIVLRRGIQN